MPRSKKPGGEISEKRRLEVILEDVLSRLGQLADGQVQLDQKMDRQIGQLREEMHQRFSVIEQIVKQNSADIRKNSEDIRKNSSDIELVKQALVELRQEVRLVSDRMKEHEKAHAS
ncbi:MAG: hypothetical protein HYZ90_04160 [Candidatus Omnitrophica bacterium]|nr:hypothetical protein [Candidatus Omnitrophota bacterium]